MGTCYELTRRDAVSLQSINGFFELLEGRVELGASEAVDGEQDDI